MLKIWFYENKNDIDGTDGYFDSIYKSSWITQELSKKMIKDIDKSDVIAENIIESPILGTIPPQWLSGGVKTLILINNLPDKIINADQLGNNCSKWLLEIAKDKDITIELFHLLEFEDNDEFEIEIMNTGKIVKNMKEYLNEFIYIQKK